jgi:hypothetical protein
MISGLKTISPSGVGSASLSDSVTPAALSGDPLEIQPEVPLKNSRVVTAITIPEARLVVLFISILPVALLAKCITI